MSGWYHKRTGRADDEVDGPAGQLGDGAVYPLGEAVKAGSAEAAGGVSGRTSSRPDPQDTQGMAGRRARFSGTMGR